MDKKKLINYSRGVAVFLMLWGHCIQCCCLGNFDFFENSVFKFIYTFHMSLFMFISGYCFYYSFIKRDMKELLIHKTQALLQPIIMCTILVYFMVQVPKGILQEKWGVIFGGKYLNYLESFWFLWSVLASSITVTIVGKTIKNELLSIIFMFLGVIIVALFPCTISNIFVYPYFVIGFLLNKYEKQIIKFKYKKIVVIMPMLFLTMLFFYNKDCYIYTTGLTGGEGIVKHMPINIFRWAIGLFGSITIILFVVIGMKINIFKNKFGDIINLLGQKSLQVYTLSVIILSNYLPIIHRKVVAIIGTDIFSQNMIIYNFVFTLFLAFCYSIILILIIKFLEKFKVSNILFYR